MCGIVGIFDVSGKRPIARELVARMNQSLELSAYTHALYDARELAIERLQDEAEALDATGIVGVTVSENKHSWRTNPGRCSRAHPPP